MRMPRAQAGRSRGLALRAAAAFGTAWLLVAGSGASARPDPGVGAGPGAVGTARALIVVGLPGDLAHRAKWSETVRRWRAWLTGPLGFDPAEVRVLADRDVAEEPLGPATREAIAARAADLRRALRPGDRLWVFWLGHANHDGEHLFLHLPGPDLRGDEFAALFRGLTCREQVFWMTSAGSGWLVKPLAAPGRVVAAATEPDQEFNETEFPQALAAVVSEPPAGLAEGRDGGVSLRALFAAVAAAVDARFAADGRLPTEHARLDDDGDGVGTEAADLAKGGATAGDGRLAARVRLKIPTAPANP